MHSCQRDRRLTEARHSCALPRILTSFSVVEESYLGTMGPSTGGTDRIDSLREHASVQSRTEWQETLAPRQLKALSAYGLIDALPEKGYEELSKLAAYVCGTPYALISFVDRDRKWLEAKLGCDYPETHRSSSFFARTIASASTLVIPDAQIDERFNKDPLVVEHPRLRFYAGTPIVERDGSILGIVCSIDTQPRTMSAGQTAAFEALARQVLLQFQQGAQIGSLQKLSEEVQILGHQQQGSERRLQTLVNALPALAWTANSDGWISWYNRRWYEYTGTTPQEMEGWGWTSVHEPSVLPSVMARWTASIRTGRSFEMIFPLKGVDGLFRPFLTRVEPVRNEENEIIQWLGTNTEVGELHKTQLALERSQAGLNQVLNATTDAVVSIDRAWKITYLNPRAEELYGSSGRLVGKTLWETFLETTGSGSPPVEQFHRAMYEGIPGTLEIVHGQSGNLTLGLEVYPSKDGIVTFSRDTTKLKHATAAILQHEKLAAVGRLASSIAHEINNPLEAVTNLLYLARTSVNLEENQAYLESADVELRRVSSIASQTLRFHRQATLPASATFAQLIDGIFTGLQSRLLNSGAQVLKRDRAVKPIFCLEGEIRQVLANFIINALDAMHGLGGTLYLRCRNGQNLASGEYGLIATVADTGTGMSSVTRAKLFDAFYTTKGIGGTGLGLWISKEIIDRHGGAVSLRTSQRATASGTVIRLFLPQRGPRQLSNREEIHT